MDPREHGLDTATTFIQLSVFRIACKKRGDRCDITLPRRTRGPGGRIGGNTPPVEFELGSTTSAGELKRKTGAETSLCRKKRKVEMSGGSSGPPQDTATQKSSRRVF